MNDFAPIQFAPGMPVLHPRNGSGFIAEVNQTGGRMMLIGGNGIEAINNQLVIVWEYEAMSRDIARQTAAPWIDAAKRAGLPMVADYAERYEAAKQELAASQAAQRLASDNARADASAARAAFEAEHAGKVPANAKAVIVAELMQDASDSMTDYFHSKTTRTIILAFSTHGRDLFAEMRKAALNHPETADLADAPESAENRQKYSMGGGYFLKTGSRHSTGWKVSKQKFWGERTAIQNVPSGEWAVPDETKPARVAGPVAVGGIAIEEHTHTKRGFQMFICIMPGRVDRAEFDRLRNAAEALGGWYSKPWGKTPGGFAFKERDDAEAFANATPAETCQATAEPAASRTNPATGDKLRALADKLQSDIDNKQRDRQTNTPKRQREAASARQEGARLIRTQKAMRALADLHDAGAVPPLLAQLTTKAAIYELCRSFIDTRNAGYYDAGIDTGRPAAETPQTAALWELIGGPSQAEKAAEELRRKIEALQFAKIPGYFPTPAPIIARMIEAANIPDGHVTILEPSAGSGAILDAVHEAHPDALLYACETHSSLCEVLKLKGYRAQYHDFMEVEADPIWDFVLMNPPFENGQDMAHVRHAFDMVKPGGRLVAIMSPGPFYRQDRKAQDFREWFDDLAGEKEDIAAGAFKESGTGVATVMVTICKGGDTAPAEASTSARTIRTGSCHFQSLGAARAYYARQGEDAAAVLDKLEEGAIHIGPPEAKPGQRIVLDHSEGRYMIESEG